MTNKQTNKQEKTTTHPSTKIKLLYIGLNKNTQTMHKQKYAFYEQSYTKL